MRAGFRLIGIAPQRAADGMRGVAIVIEDEVGVTAFAIQPAPDLAAILLKGGADRMLSGLSISPGGSGGNIVFAAKPLAKLIVSASDVFAEGVASGGFILGQVAGTA
jgi:hypothetical protein